MMYHANPRQAVDPKMPKATIQVLRERAGLLGGTIRETEDFGANGGLYVLTDGNDAVRVPLDGIGAELDRWEAVDNSAKGQS